MMAEQGPPIKVAYLTALGVHRHGGTEKCSAWLIEDMAQEHRVTVFADRVEDIKKDNIEIVRVPTITRPVLFRFTSFLAVSSLILAWKAFKGERFDIIHTTGADCFFANVITAHFCQARWIELRRAGVVQTLHRTLGQKAKYYLLHQPYSYLVRFLERRIFAGRRVRTIIAVSEGLKRDLVRYYRLAPERIVAIPNAVDERIFLSEKDRTAYRNAIRGRHGLAPDDRVLLYVAAGDWHRKGLPLLLEAMSLLPEPTLKLLVVGGDDISLYRRMAAERGVSQRVVFAGLVADVRQYYAAGDVFVYPSSFEAFALVTLEAAGARLPIIATRINGTEELIKDGFNGFFVQPDPGDIAEKVARLIADEELRGKMGERAREAARGFSRQDASRQTQALYRQVLAQKE